MAKDKKRNTGQLFNFLKDSYLDRTSRPIYALLYILIFIILYEIGILAINPEALNQSLNSLQGRVIAFLWIQDLMELIGFSGKMIWIATPSVVIIMLFAFQITSRSKWRVYFKDFIPMTLECIALVLPLLVLSLMVNRKPVNQQSEIYRVQSSIVYAQSAINSETVGSGGAENTDSDNGNHSLITKIVTGLGAGIYEELVFRLILIGILMLIFQDICKFTKSNSIFLSVVVSALLFSGHHYFILVNGHIEQGDPFKWTSFIFRALAGGYFAIIYAVRGFGIATGTHAFYDIIAALVEFYLINPANELS